jgi:broad specificity phosphatase PhoE
MSNNLAKLLLGCFISMILTSFIFSCSDGEDVLAGSENETDSVKGNAADGDADTDTDSDSDSDTDSDADSDTDSDTDTDTDSDADTDTDSDTDTDTDSDADTDTDSDADTDTDSDADTDTDSDADTDTDSDTDGDDTATEPDSNNGGGLTVYYIRHAETLANILPPEEWTFEASNEFSELGNTQVAELADWLINSGVVPVPDKVLVSPTWRGQNTISPYLVQMNIMGEIWPELTEVDDEPKTGGPIPTEVEPEKWMTYPVEAENVAYRDGVDDNAIFPEGYEEGLAVVMMARNLLLERYSQSGKTIIIVGHAHAGRLMFGLLEGHDMVEDAPNDFAYILHNTGVTRVEQDPETGDFEVVDSNINDPPGAPTWGR